MPPSINMKLLRERHGMMLTKQESILKKYHTPENLSISELADLWGLKSPGSTHYIVQLMLERGWVVKRRGYYAIEQTD